MNKKSISLLMAAAMAAFSMTSVAEAPAGYYDKCNNLGGAALLKALYNTVSAHTTVSYDGLYDVYETSDVRENGTVWDMYSTKQWTVNKNTCGSYKAVGDCYNREHSFPKSWFSKASPMVSDAFHVYPTDGKVNGQRSNYPYGECANGTRLPSHNGVDALGRLGSSTFPGYSGTVFEPDDQYKGDFARTYFYMAACYNNRISNWSSEMLSGDSYPAFSNWAINLLLKWHRQDPVSKKESDRNDAVYAHQHNRNPFIDHPEMVEYIWGDKKSEKWTMSGDVNPQVNRPIDGSTIDLGVTSIGRTLKYIVNIKTSYLEDNLKLSLSTSDFTVSPQYLSYEDVNTDHGDDATISFTPKKEGSFTAKLSIIRVATNEVLSTVNVKAQAIAGLPLREATNIGTDCFTVNWQYVGDQFSDGCYSLTVADAAGVLNTYPRRVKAADETYTVTDLQPNTNYTYSISSVNQTSETKHVLTANIYPSIEIFYDGDLSFIAEPGTPSEEAELFVETENIEDVYTIEVSSPFEVSTDHSNWSTCIEMDPYEDRFYMRVNSEVAGKFETHIIARIGDYLNDDAMVEANVSEQGAFLEDFEAEITTQGYDGGEWVGTAATWLLYNVGIYATDGVDSSNGCRYGKQSDSSITMTSDKAYGAGTVKFDAARWSSTDGNAEIQVLYSTDKGETWQLAGSVSVEDDKFQSYSVAVNEPGMIRLKFQQTTGKRLIIDNISVSNFNTTAVDEIDIHTWDAYSLNGALVITSQADAHVAVYGVDGITYYDGEIAAGQTSMTLAQGLYIVAIGDFTRRVVVK